MTDLHVEEDLVEDIADDESSAASFKYAITSYGADYPVDGLVKRLETDALFVPDFQRRYVWTNPQACRFVESFLLGLPVPGVFFAKVDDTQQLLIIDGQQRLLTLQYFYDGVFAPTGRQFTLKDVQPQFEGKSYKTLTNEDRLRLDDSIIHATIVRQDEPSQDKSSIYHVFERLNTGGTPLSAQEIRTCIYYGNFVDLLRVLNDNSKWREIFGKPSPRMKDQELILRFLAMQNDAANYSRPLKSFLNSFMGNNRSLSIEQSKTFKHQFESTIAIAYEALGQKAFRPTTTLNVAVFDAVMVGICNRLQTGPIDSPEQLKSAYQELLKSETFVDAYKRSTTDETRVRDRMKEATESLGNVT